MDRVKKHIKSILTLLILAVTIIAFGYYFAAHPNVRQQLLSVPPLVLVALLGLYSLFTGSLALILVATLKLCRATIPTTESLLLTIYSSIVNFFGPLQSGPGFRAVYLRKRHKVYLKNYALATLLYYGFFAGFSAISLLSGLIGWRWITLLVVTGIVLGLALLRSPLPLAVRIRKLNLRGLGLLAAATLLQVLLVAVIYFVELRAVDTHIAFSQALIYTGAANFALFVSLTPGAIGFRETFLLFSSNLHGIDHQTVLAASLIDRAFYVAFLGLSFLIALGFHAKDRLQISSLKAVPVPTEAPK